MMALSFLCRRFKIALAGLPVQTASTFGLSAVCGYTAQPPLNSLGGQIYIYTTQHLRAIHQK